MMIEQIPILNVSVWEIIRILFLIGIGVYVVFALVVVRQVQLMTDTIRVGFETPIRLIALIHLLVACGVFVLALLIL